ncbi:MAG TPA: RNA methyltransferase [Anaerolineales bacterium]|nr:RNA methyltransferase [Anaerolineales bacterium]
MEKPLITSLGNSLVKQARSLRQKKTRTETGYFLVEGIHHVGEAVEAGWQVDNLLYAPDLLGSKFAKELVARLADRSQPVSAPVMESLADKENPQGILAVVRQRHVQLPDLQINKISVALVSPQDPGNLGAILRTMDAVGAEALFVLDGGVDVYHPTVVRSSMGTIFWKPIVQTSFGEFAAWARAGGCQLIGTSAHADVDYQTLVPQTPWVLIMGSEQKGLSAEQIKACDVTVSLPIQGRVSSLNLAVAAGVLLYALKP